MALNELARHLRAQAMATQARGHLPATATQSPRLAAAACLVQSAVGFGFGVVLLHELDHRQALLELDDVDRHYGAHGGEGVIVIRRRSKSRDGRLRFGANQVGF